MKKLLVIAFALAMTSSAFADDHGKAAPATAPAATTGEAGHDAKDAAHAADTAHAKKKPAKKGEKTK